MKPHKLITIGLVLLLGVYFTLPADARVARSNNEVERIAIEYPNVDKQGLMELNRRILSGELETGITLNDIERFLSNLEEVEDFNRALFEDKYRKIAAVRFDFSTTGQALRINLQDSRLTIYPNSSLFEIMIKKDSKISALEEIGHLYTAPSTAIIEFPNIKNFIDVLTGERKHPFIEGFNNSLDFREYFMSHKGYFNDFSVIDSINEVINTKILLDIYGDRYKRAISEENGVEFNSYKPAVTKAIVEKGSQVLEDILPHVARFELIFSLLGAEDKAAEVRIYAMRIIEGSQTGFDEAYISFYESLRNLAYSVTLKEEFSKRLETRRFQILIDEFWELP